MGPEVWRKALLRREEIITHEKDNPLTHGWEPPIWTVVDALLGFDWIEPELAQTIRSKLGFDNPVKIVLINGGNRAGKSEYAAKRVTKMLNNVHGARAWCFHTSSQMSIEYQQPLMWKFMPKEFKQKPIMSPTTYISFKMKTGFSEQNFVLPNLSLCSFRNYTQDRDTIEGGEIDIFWADELIPPDWVDTMMLRIATRAGRGVISFTPVQGYTGTVRAFLDGAKPARKTTAFLCPKDEGDPDIERALALEKCMDWVTDGSGQPAIPSGRRFDEVPRIMRCMDPRKAVIFFHSCDNPYGNPREVIDIIKPQPKWFQLERYYGVSHKSASTKFPKFKPEVHLVAADKIPTTGTNYMIVDPCSGRNFFMIWVRVTEDHCYIYREWPGKYEIPGVGFVGPWADPTGDNKLQDGKRGSAQDTIGWTCTEYKKEIARIEGWPEYETYDPRAAYAAEQDGDNGHTPTMRPESDLVAKWRENLKRDEMVVERYMDSRFANAKKIGADNLETLLEQFSKIGLTFFETEHKHGEHKSEIDEGCQMINDALGYDAERPLDFFNQPYMLVNEECWNCTFALQNYTGLDGQKGACKDPVDCIRYFFMKGLVYIGEDHWESVGGGTY